MKENEQKILEFSQEKIERENGKTRKDSFVLFNLKIILNVFLIVYIGIVLGLIFMVYFFPAKFEYSKEKSLKTEAPPAKNEKTEWSIYANEAYGFEFSYPQDRQVEDLTDIDAFNYGQDKSLLMLAVESEDSGEETAWIEVKEGGDLDKAISDFVDEYCVIGGGIAKEEKIIVGGAEGKAVYFNDLCEPDEENPWIFVAKDSQMFIFGVPIGGQSSGGYFDKIVSSFKFKN